MSAGGPLAAPLDPDLGSLSDAASESSSDDGRVIIERLPFSPEQTPLTAREQCWAMLCSAFYIDFTAGPVVSDCLAAHNLERLLEGRSMLDRDKEIFLLEEVSTHTHEDVRRMNARTGNDDEILVLDVIFALKLGLSLVAYGMPTIDAEHTITDLCVNGMKMPKPDLDFSLRKLTARFIEGTHTIQCARGIDFDRLTSCAELTDTVLSTPSLLATEDGVNAAIWTLHQIQTVPKPYGWMIQLLNSEALCVFAAVGAYSGSWGDAQAVALTAPVVIAAASMCEHWGKHLKSLKLVLCPLLTGTMTALVYRNVYPESKLCRVCVWYLSVILIHLPGSDVVYGAYEALHASVANGAARVVGAVLQAMMLAVCLNVGWQFTGREAVPTMMDPVSKHLIPLSGAAASFVPFSSCQSENADHISWQLAYGACNIALITNICIAFNMRLSKLAGPLLVAWVSLFLFGYMSFELAGSHTLSGHVVNVVTLFLAGTLAVMLELIKGYPSCIPIIPVVLILAPGSSAVRISLGDMQHAGGVVGLSMGIWDDLVLNSVSCAVGLYIVLEAWKSPLRIKRRLRARMLTNMKRLTDSFLGDVS